MKIVIPSVCIAVLLIAMGCGQKTETSDVAERDHPAMKKALTLERAGNKEGARLIYQGLLDQNPTIARAHLALAFLLEEEGGDYPAALYHYQRYLTLRPDTEKRDMIEARIRTAKLAYVGTVFTNQAAILSRMGAMERDNAALKIRALNLEAQASHLRAALAASREKYAESRDEASRVLDKKGIPTLAPRTAGKAVRVQKGDTLRRISERVYGTQDRWRDIFEANRTVLKNREDIRIGQTLIVPEREHP
jgi:tetratricopeptide (TPR) repeat protein